MSKPITIQGISFPSMSAAATHFGVSVAAIYQAKKRQRLNWVGKGAHFCNRRYCEIAGINFESVNQAASYLGCRASDISAYRKVKALIDAKQAGGK